MLVWVMFVKLLNVLKYLTSFSLTLETCQGYHFFFYSGGRIPEGQVDRMAALVSNLLGL